MTPPSVRLRVRFPRQRLRVELAGADRRALGALRTSVLLYASQSAHVDVWELPQSRRDALPCLDTHGLVSTSPSPCVGVGIRIHTAAVRGVLIFERKLQDGLPRSFTNTRQPSSRSNSRSSGAAHHSSSYGTAAVSSASLN